ncbi:MAG: BrxA/BrxB family bacilliredoxin [Planctomycetes bacterium]|nr:BrxA/BrxB family bacilliredoxin [Planctomycetota bacterium]
MPYPEEMVAPMRAELTRLGVDELRTAADVERFAKETKGTALLVVNSVCGCAAGGARPAVSLALRHAVRPDRTVTVFAGQDVEATARARAMFPEYPPSSPSMALLKDGKVVHFVPRHMIEGRDGKTIATDLVAAFEKHCAKPAAR